MAWDRALIDGPIEVPILGGMHEDGYRPVTGWVEGYHLNVAPSLMSEALEPFLVEPETPERVFAGAETVFLKFATEAEARSVLSAYWRR